MGEGIPDGPMAPPPKRRNARYPMLPAELTKAITAAENRLCRLIDVAMSKLQPRLRASFQVRNAAEEARKAIASTPLGTTQTQE